MSDEFDELLDEETPPEPLPASEPLDHVPVQEPERSALPDAEPRSTLVTASSLLDPSDDQDEGDFEPGGKYKGFEIMPPREWPTVPNHLSLPRRFYVRFNDTVGLVPWAGSKIIWPWESAWDQDLHRDQVESFLKEPEKKEKKR